MYAPKTKKLKFMPCANANVTKKLTPPRKFFLTSYHQIKLMRLSIIIELIYLIANNISFVEILKLETFYFLMFI